MTANRDWQSTCTESLQLVLLLRMTGYGHSYRIIQPSNSSRHQQGPFDAVHALNTVCKAHCSSRGLTLPASMTNTTVIMMCRAA